MKLSEIKQIRPHLNHDTIEVEPAGGIFGVFEVDVDYTYEPASRAGGHRTPAELLIEKVTLAEDVEERDLDDRVVNRYSKGMDARKLPGWDRSDDDYVYTELRDRLDYYN